METLVDSELTRPVRWLIILAACYGLAWGCVLLTGVATGSSSVLLTSVAYSVAAVLAGSAILLVSKTQQAEERRAWLFIGLGTLSWAVADAIWTYYDVVGAQIPYPGLPDLFYLAAYPLWIVGVVAFPSSRGGRYSQWRLVLDGMAGTAALALLMWYLYLNDVVSFEGGTWLERVVNPAYPLCDVLLLSGLIILSVRRTPQRLHRPLLILALGVMCNAGADIVYWVHFDSYQSGNWIDGLWVIRYGLFALAAFAASRPSAVPVLPDRRVSMSNLIVPYAPVVVLTVLSGQRIVSGTGYGDSKGLLLGAGVVCLIVIVRQSLALREVGETVERERHDLVASISHELRTPLTALSGFAQILGESPDLSRDDRIEITDIVVSQARHLNRIVGDLLQVTQGDLGRTHLNLGDLAVGELVTSTIDMLSDRAAATTITAHVQPGLTVRADRDRLRQVLLNYLSNAIRYGRDIIEVHATQTPKGVLIEVHDNGPGVPKKHEITIWDRFDRGAHANLSKVQGSGLGLAIVRDLIAAHRGRTGYRRSEPLGGACFWLTIPTSGGEPAHGDLQDNDFSSEAGARSERSPARAGQ